MSTEDRKPTGPMTSREVEIHATVEQVWQAIATGAGNAGWLFPAEIAPLAGIVETSVETAEAHGCVLRTDDPSPGIFAISTFSMDGQTVTVNVVGRLYGEGVAAVADRDEPRWADWLSQRFPAIDPMTVPR